MVLVLVWVALEVQGVRGLVLGALDQDLVLLEALEVQGLVDLVALEVQDLVVCGAQAVVLEAREVWGLGLLAVLEVEIVECLEGMGVGLG